MTKVNKEMYFKGQALNLLNGAQRSVQIKRKLKFSVVCRKTPGDFALRKVEWPVQRTEAKVKLKAQGRWDTEKANGDSFRM